MLTTLLLALCLVAPAPAPVADGKEVRKQFLEHFEKKDKDALVALWKANPGFVLPTIDADLEGSLREQEKGNPPDQAKVGKLHERALFGAECAVVATGHPILGDYASSFVGWNAAQKLQFRDGQKVFKAAMDALAKPDAATAKTKARECIERASALGDWWGTAMGYDALGRACQALGGTDDAITALSQARLLNRDLGLQSDEYEELTLLAQLCSSAGRWPRAAVFARDGQVLAKALGDEAGLKKLAELEQQARQK